MMSLVLVCLGSLAQAQTQTIAANSYIINMGSSAPTTGNSLKPYGLVYELLKTYKVPVYWVINASKAKDGTDFSHNGVAYKGGTFIIPAAFRSTAVNSRIAFYQGLGMTGASTTSEFTVPVTYTLTTAPVWTLDAQNGGIAEKFLINAGIPSTAYSWKTPAKLTSCDQFYVMPHADPLWSTHGNLYTWNQTARGAIWAGCHAVSVLENMVNPANGAQQTNFLTLTGLIDFGSHAAGTLPFTHLLPADPNTQYMGGTDLAHQNGSEQIYIPLQTAGGGWRPSTHITAYDPTQKNVPTLRSDRSNAAALIVYGRGMGQSDRGFVMYEAGHDLNKATAHSVAAQRAFLDFSFFQGIEKAPQISTASLTEGMKIYGGITPSFTASAASVFPGNSFTYKWSSSCGGSFSAPASATTTFTPPVVAQATSCVLTLTVMDACGRTSFKSVPVTILPPNRVPVPAADNASLDPLCGTASLAKNVLANDADPDGDVLSLTAVTGNANGTVSFSSGGNVTYTPNKDFFGLETLTYTVCDKRSPALCASGTYIIAVGDASKAPVTTDDQQTITEDNRATINVLANDQPGTGATSLVLSGLVSAPAHGTVSVNPDYSVTYVPDADYSGTDAFVVRVVNDLGYSRTETVTVTVKSDGCSGGTYTVTGAGAPGSVALGAQRDTYLSLNDNNKNFGACTSLLVDGESSKKLRSLLRFDLSSLPAGMVITGATLKMQLTSAQSSTAYDISAHRVTAAWEEGTGACGGSTGVPSWVTRTGTTAWTTAGGDFASAPYATTAVSTTGAYSWNLTTLVQDWYSGDYANEGLLLKFDNETLNNQIKTFASRTHGTPAYQPVLTIHYAPATSCAPIPARAPLSLPDTATTQSVAPVTIEVAANDHLMGAAVTGISVSTAPSAAQGTASVVGNTIVFTPVSSFNGIASFQYQLTTSNGSDSATAYVVVTNSPVTAADDAATAPSGVTQTVNVKANDVDPEGRALLVTIATAPRNGTASVDASGNIVYVPYAGFTGNDTLYYSVCEDAAAAASCAATAYCAGARLVLTAANRAPSAGADTRTVLPCLPVTLNLVANDSDPEGGVLSLTGLSAPNPAAAGSLTNNGDGTVTYTPAPGFTGTFTFTYTLADNGIPSQTATGTVTITVSSPANTAPVAVDDAETTLVGQTLYADVRENDYDPEGLELSVPVITMIPAHGTATVLANGLVRYVPDAGFSGTDVLTYRVYDQAVNQNTCVPSEELAATATLTITVALPNYVQAANDQNSTWINTPVSGNVLGNDSDPDTHTPLSFLGFYSGSTLVTSGSLTVYEADGSTVAGTLVPGGNGTYTFTPVYGYTGTAVVPYKMADTYSAPATATACLTIIVYPDPAHLVLPLRLHAFDAVAAGPGRVSLRWKTLEEENTARFEVEHSRDGRTYTSVGTVAAAGRALEASYAFGYDRAAEGKNFFRLRMVDRDEQYTYSPVRQVTLSGAKAGELTVFPNPVRNGSATLRWSGAPGGSMTLRVFDGGGRLVALYPSVFSQAPDLSLVTSGWKKGIYRLVLSDGSRTFGTTVVVP
ncbi:Ig-like domain-containing protein [Paraflavisolibacter sp. H34]|uniref:Ig-like domain-containing protein n=1 Tax=Huijunlia imazamoxiresistens TaxID=3127457 RepID=UPI0030199286